MQRLHCYDLPRCVLECDYSSGALAYIPGILVALGPTPYLYSASPSLENEVVMSSWYTDLPDSARCDGRETTWRCATSSEAVLLIT